jgi:hypothetical protein
MESKTHTSKKKATTKNTPANQSLLAFTAPPQSMSDSPQIKAPYDKADKVATTF